MEPHRMPRRSQSNGTLRSTHSNPVHPLHKPLSRVNENSALLSSHGALEGMLKTTTETGDIGLFSIKSVPGTTLGIPSGGRIPVRNKHAPLPPRRLVDRSRRYDNRKRLPSSSRDTASEIISMYGSNSQGSVTSTPATSLNEPGQRSYSMTTVGSRHLSHNKSNATLQSQASSGPLQRPRSPFPYPTRLKRPGARPVSPAVTDAGIVDYSRMVEIDRISLRTGHGPLKSSYPYVHRRPPLGFRSDVDSSTPSLNGPPMRRPPGPPSLRTASAASIASWNAGDSSARDRFNSSSSRTSSLTSVVNMYYRMPSALKAAQFGPAGPPPRYYDYTEEFENKLPSMLPSVEPVAPTPTRAPSVERALVLREGSEEQLSATFDLEAGLVSSDDESQQENSRAETESHLLSDIELLVETIENKQDSIQSQPSSKLVSNMNQCTPVGSSMQLGPRRLTRGSDIDMLPSQIGRASVDTFRPSLDVKSKEMPLFRYPKLRQSAYQQTNTPSPARRVQVLGKTPTIKSEQGVILRGDDESIDNDHNDEDGAALEIAEKCGGIVSSPSKWRSVSDSTHSLLKVSSVSKASRRQITVTDPFEMSSSQARMKPEMQISIYSPGEGWRKEAPKSLEGSDIPPVPSKATESAILDSLTSSPNINNLQLSRTDKDSTRDFSNGEHGSRCQRNPRGLEIRTEDLPRYGKKPLQLTPLIAPKPISPVRELRVKDSIPKLMKSLPPLPGQPGYILPSPPTTPADDDDDDFAEILKPCTSLDELKSPPKPTSASLSKQPPDIQKKLPRIRIRSKGPDVKMRPNKRDSRPWNSDSNYPWCNNEPDIELANIRAEDSNNRVSLNKKLKLRGSRTVCGGTPFGTVRWRPEVHRSEPIAEFVSEQSKDLFSIPHGLSAAFRQVGRKFSQGSDRTIKHRTLSSSNPRTVSTCSRHTSRKAPMLVTEARENLHTNSRESPKRSIVKQRRGIRKRLSNLKWLLARDSPLKPRTDTATKTEFQLGKRRAGLDRTFGLDHNDFESEDYISGDTVTINDEQRPRFRRRIKTKISKWMRGTKSALRSSRKETRGTIIV